MIVVNGKFVMPAGAVAAMGEAFATMEKACQAENGCYDYTYSVEVSNPNVIRLTEKWTDIDALRAHFQAPHMADFREAMSANPPESAEVTFFEAEEIDPTK